MNKKYLDSLSEIVSKQPKLHGNISTSIVETVASYSDMVNRISPTVIQVAQQHRDFVERLSSYSDMVNRISPTVIQVAQRHRDFIERLSSYSSMIESISPTTIQIAREQKNFINQISPSVNQYVENYQNLLKQINPQSFTNLLSQIDISHVISAINNIEYPEFNESHNEIQFEVNVSNNTGKYLTEAEVIALLDERFQSVRLNEKNFVKRFFEELAISIGVDVVKGLLYSLLILLVLGFGIKTVAFHEKLIEDIQEKADSNIIIKHYLEEQGLLNYEHLNLIGITRVEAFIRVGKSKNAPLINNTKLGKGTVVSILEQKNGWIKIQVDREKYCIEGWIEESKVNKFKKVK